MSDINFNPEETVIELKFPIMRAGAGGATSSEITKIKLGRFKFKHIQLLPKELMDAVIKKKIDTTAVGKLIPLIGALSGLTDEEVGEIDFVDLTEVVGKLGSVVGK